MAAAIAISIQEAKDDDEVLSCECRDHGFCYSNNAGHGLHGPRMSKQAKVSITEARAIALKAHPGKIVDEELEKEKGGIGLRYSFDIKRGAVTQEVGVDAQTGKVLENKKEGPHPD